MAKDNRPVEKEPERLTDKEEIALALVLWKFWRSRPKFGGHRAQITPDMEAVANKSLELAKLAGVKKEFFDLLFELPVIRVKCKELDKWVGVRPCVGSPNAASMTLSPPKRQPGRNGKPSKKSGKPSNKPSKPSKSSRR